jgi:hypothetical protein
LPPRTHWLTLGRLAASPLSSSMVLTAVRGSPTCLLQRSSSGLSDSAAKGWS